MKTEKTRRGAAMLLFCGWLVYFAAIAGRMNYSASMVAIIEATGATKDSAGLVASFFFFAYGAGQLVNGLLCKRYNTRYAILGALTVSAACNIGLPFCSGVETMKFVWMVNGMAQSVLWSSLIKIQSEYLTDKELDLCVVLMGTTTVCGTFFSYGFSALFVALGDWRITFYVASGVIAVAAAAWFFGVGYTERKLVKTEQTQKQRTQSKDKKTRRLVWICIGAVVVFAVVNGFIKDSLNTWVPTLLKETYSLETYFSIILTLVLPVISFFGVFGARLIRRRLPNDIFICGLFYTIGAGALALLLWLYTRNLAVTVILFGLISCLMSGINSCITSAVPFAMRMLGPSGLFAGIIDTACYVGSTLASYLTGYVADNSGWNAVIVMLLACSAVAAVAALVFSRYWKKRMLPLVFAQHNNNIRESAEAPIAPEENDVISDDINKEEA